MKQHWDVEELVEHFTLLPPEISFLGKNMSHNRLGKALLLKFFQYEGRFPEDNLEIPQVIIEHVAQQLGVSSELMSDYKWDGRTIKEHRRQIRELLGFHPATMADQEALRSWITDDVLPHEHRQVHLEQLAYQHLREQQIEPPTKRQLERLITSALHQYEQSFFDATAARLSKETKDKLRELIYKKEYLTTKTDIDEVVDDDPGRYLLHDLKSGPGDAKVANLKKVADRLKILQQVGLPNDLFLDIPLRFLRQYRQQVAVESISHLQRRHENPHADALLAVFCWVRQQEITDQLVELFIQVLNTTRLRAEQQIKRELLGEYIRVDGKQGLLYRLAEAMSDHPDGIIREILYPLVGEERLHSLVEDTLVVTELSRLGRSTGQVINLIHQLMDNGIRIIIIKQNLVLDTDQDDIQSLTMITMLALFAELERVMISRRTKDALATKKAQGIELGKPKGTIQQSIYDKDRKRIIELLSLGVPQRRISTEHLGYGYPSSLNYYINTRHLHDDAEKLKTSLESF